jgi:hypothetical protein
MRTPPRRLLLALATATTLASCGGGGGLGGFTVTPMRAGALYPTKGDTCGLRFENLTFQEASSKYEGLGMVTVTGVSGDEFTDPMKHDVEKAACHMGGDAVSLNTSGPGFFNFLVWRNRR